MAATQHLLLSVVACLGLVLSACTSGVAGTYRNEHAVLELHSGGEATLTVLDVQAPCPSYVVIGENVSLKCSDGPLVFTRQDDGSLAAPAGYLIGTLRKAR
jgi:hypothetical protein